MKNEWKSKLYIETPFNVDYTVEFMNVTLSTSQWFAAKIKHKFNFKLNGICMYVSIYIYINITIIATITIIHALLLNVHKQTKFYTHTHTRSLKKHILTQTHTYNHVCLYTYVYVKCIMNFVTNRQEINKHYWKHEKAHFINLKEDNDARNANINMKVHLY